MSRRLVAGLLAAALAAPVVSEARIARPLQYASDGWQRLPIAPRGDSQLGINFRLPQVDALGLEPRSALARLLGYPFHLLRLGAYWTRLEPAPGQFVTDELDGLLDAAAHAGKHVRLGLGAV